MDLEQFKAECNLAIELGDGATAGPWGEIDGKTLIHVETANIGDGKPCGMPVCSIPKKRSNDAAHIAHARTFSPAAARALLEVIEALEDNGQQGLLMCILAAFTPKD